MALIKCKECGKEISDDANACPYCGAKPTLPSGCFVAILIGLAIFGMIGVMSSKDSPPQIPPTPIAATRDVTPLSTAKVEPPLVPPNPKLEKARAKVKAMPYEQFCHSLGQTIRATAKKPDELREAMIERAMSGTGSTWDMIAGIELRQPVFGMDLCLVLATFGRPDRVNRSVSPSIERMQLVYDQRRMYLYLDNNKVTSWQD